MLKIYISCYLIFFLVQFLNFIYDVKSNKKPPIREGKLRLN